MLVAALLLSPMPLIFGPGQLSASISYPGLGVEIPVLIWAGCLGLISTGFAYLGISVVLKGLNANVYALVDIIVSPVVAAGFGYLIFSEVPASEMVYGGAMLLGAGFWLTIAMSQSSGSDRPAPKRSRNSYWPF
jgi:drug/metabolite transporter (DMT)-like permease